MHDEQPLTTGEQPPVPGGDLVMQDALPVEMPPPPPAVQPAPRYFWSGWFDGQSFFQLAALFVLLSLVDLISTLAA